MWYEKSYRRHLADMHIDDWSEEFLSEFSPEKYVENLKTAKITNAMIYLQSHVGLCYFPTNVGVMHKAFMGREDMIKRLVDLCHENGIAVSGYYSLIYNTREHDRHTDWRMLTASGKSKRENADEAADSQKLDFASARSGRYGLCCPNCLEYREFVYNQIDEMLEYFTLDGFFFDMPFWAHTCYCDNCRRRFREEFGYEMPINPKNDKEFKDILSKKYQWMGEFIGSVTDHVKARAPELSVEHNFASGIAGDSHNGCGEEVARACDFLGGDLYGGIINHSLACKFYKNITPNAPFDYMFSRCKPALASHTLTKTEDEMRSEIMLTAAHHGATMVIDAIDPVGTFDKRVYETVGKVFAEHEKYEKYFTGEMDEDIGLYYSIKSRFNTRGEIYQNKTASIQVATTLIEEHIPFGVTGNFHRLDYKALVLPMLSDFDRCDIGRIKSYLENGGRVYMSGAESADILETLVGAKLTGRTEEKNVYIAPTDNGERYFYGFNKKYPLPFDGSAPIVEVDSDSEILATLTLPYSTPKEIRFASIHSDPPGRASDIPVILRKRVGKGEIIWSALPIESIGFFEYKKIFTSILLSMIPDYKPSFTSADAPDDVEITLFEIDGYMTVNMCCITERAVNKKYPPFTVAVKCDKAPLAVKLLPNESEIPFTYENGYVYFKTEELYIFDMYQIIK